MSDPRIAVVTPTRNRAPRLTQLLASLRHQTLDAEAFEVIVVDDGSDGDATTRVVERERGLSRFAITLLRNDQSVGPAAARNAGWRAARAPLIAFTDDDCIVGPRWLELLVAAFDELGSDESVVQGPTRSAPDEAHDAGLFSRTMEIAEASPYYETCNVAYPRSTLERLGGFDADRFRRIGGEDTDLGWRARKAGVRLHFEPRAIVYHAVERKGPLGMLRTTWRHGDSIAALARHPEVRRLHLSHRIFWRPSHYFLVRSLLALLLPRRMFPVALWLAWPYAKDLYDRSRAADAPAVVGMPYLIVYDCAETAAVARGAARERVLIL